MKLYITADGLYAGTQKDAGKGHTAVDVPDKAGLIAYLNSLVREPSEAFAHGQLGEVQVETPPVFYDEAANINPAAYDKLMSAKPLNADRLCEAISELEGVPLGHVALEVAARFTALAKRSELLS